MCDVTEHAMPGKVLGRMRRYPQFAADQDAIAQCGVEPARQRIHCVTLGHVSIFPKHAASGCAKRRSGFHGLDERTLGRHAADRFGESGSRSLPAQFEIV